jgi:hypothetical protein
MTIKARIALHVEQIPERFKLAQLLSTTVQMKEGSRSAVINALWSYIKINKLQDKVDRRAIKCDQKLRYVSVFIFSQISTTDLRCHRSSRPIKCSFSKYRNC